MEEEKPVGPLRVHALRGRIKESRMKDRGQRSPSSPKRKQRKKPKARIHSDRWDIATETSDPDNMERDKSANPDPNPDP